MCLLAGCGLAAILHDDKNVVPTTVPINLEGDPREPNSFPTGQVGLGSYCRCAAGCMRYRARQWAGHSARHSARRRCATCVATGPFSRHGQLDFGTLGGQAHGHRAG